MKKTTFTKMMAVTRPPVEVENWPGYRFGLSNLPGVNLVLAHRTAKDYGVAVSLSTWGVYDEESGFYQGAHGPSRITCAANATVHLGKYTSESYATRIKNMYVRRMTTILTEGMK